MLESNPNPNQLLLFYFSQFIPEITGLLDSGTSQASRDDCIADQCSPGHVPQAPPLTSCILAAAEACSPMGPKVQEPLACWLEKCPAVHGVATAGGHRSFLWPPCRWSSRGPGPLPVPLGKQQSRHPMMEWEEWPLCVSSSNNTAPW